MATLVEENQVQGETALSFKPGGSHIQIESISIEISSGDINEAVEDCKHFSIRAFVSEQRKKDSRLCSPFISDGGDNSDTASLELPPLDVHKFRWWRCSGCVQDCNSSQGTSKEITTGKSMSSQNPGKNSCLREGECSKGLSKLFAKAAGNGFLNGTSTSSQRSAKGKQVQEDGFSQEMSKETGRGPLYRCGNSQSTGPQKLAKGNRLLQNGYSQGPSKENNVAPFGGLSSSRGASFLKTINEAVMVPFNGLNLDKSTSSRKSGKGQRHLQKVSSSRGLSKVVMGPPSGFANNKGTSPKVSKEQNFQKSAVASQGTSKEFAMPPPGGFSNSKQSSHKSGKSSRLQHHGTSRGASKDASILPITGHASGKGTSALKLSKQQNVQTPKPNGQKGETSTAASLHKKRNYAKRSVQQAEIARDKIEIHKGGENGFASNSNRESLQHGVAREGDVRTPERFNDDEVPLQVSRKEEAGSCNKLVEQISNFTTSGRTPGSAGQSLLKQNQFVSADGGDSSPDEGGPYRNFNTVRPLVESNRLFNRPPIDIGLEAGRINMYEEEEEEDYRGMPLRRVPKIRLLSDVIAKYPTNVGEQPDNSQASPGVSDDISPGRGVSANICEQSNKRKASPVASHETSTEKGISDKAGEQLTKTKAFPVGSHDIPAGRGISVSSSWKKRKRQSQDGEEHLADSFGGSKRISVRFAEPENKVPPTSHYRQGVDVSAEATFLSDARKQGKHPLDRTEVEKKSKKARVQNVALSSVPSQSRHVSRDNCERSFDRHSSAEVAAISGPVHGGYITDGGRDNSNKSIFFADKAERAHGYSKKNIFPQLEEDCQTASKFLQFGPINVENVPGDSTSDCIIIGSGLYNRRRDVVENRENSSTPLSTVADYCKTSVPTRNELWTPQVQARGTLVDFKGGEGSSFTQQKGSTAEAKGRMKDIDINSIPVDDKTPEQGSTDDIPMDIVELLAKHQHERRCDDREKLSLLEPRGERTAQKQQYPSLLKPQSSYCSNGVGRQFEVMGPGKQILSDNLFEPSRKNVLVGYPKDDHFCARFNGYIQSQGQVPGGAQYSCSMGSTAKSWNGNTSPLRPASRSTLQPVQSFNRYQGLSTQIWPPSMPSRVHLGGLTNQGMYSQGSDMIQQGKVNQGTISFNFERPSIGNQSSSSTTQPWNSRTSEIAANGGRQKATDFLSPKVIRSVDLSSNETIPAMQLLNLVQVAGSSRSSTPPVNANTEFLKKLPFDQADNQYKHYAPGPHFEPYNNRPTGAASSSRNPLYESEGRTSFGDKGCQCSPALPTTHMFGASAFQNDQTVGTSSGPKNPIAFTSRDQRNMGSSSYNPLVGDLSSDRNRKSTSGSKNAIAAAGHDAPMSSSNFVQQPIIRKPVLDTVPRCEERAHVPLPKAEICMVNRNPAEILDLKECRSYMIGPEDLRRGKSVVASSSRLVPNSKRPQTIPKGKGRERLQKS